MSIQGGASRMYAKAVLEERIKRTQRELDALKVLLNEVNWDHLSQQDEELLWGLFAMRGGL